ncbi:MAG: DUF2182 domain-containing protein [Acetobacteraceae bacterium]|nr:DUF2182 domain-containing protein [Acetobacteraceae bacterium]
MPVARHPATLLLGGLIGAAWLSLYMWDQSPYARYLDHGRWTDLGFASSLCRAVPGGDWLLPGALYASGWVLMTAAMMLPSVVPLLRRFERLAAGRADRAGLLGLLVTGYLLAWVGFGAVAHLFDAVLHAAAGHSAWLAANAWAASAGTLAVAGLFQFSKLKYRCADRCRTPLGFIIQHWRGRAPRREALRLGLHHGLFCVACCWALMLLMFVIGAGNLGWMLALGAVMALEKNAAWGRSLSKPLGAGLLAWAGVLVAANVQP